MLCGALVGCGGGQGVDVNPWQGEYLGVYEDEADRGTMHVWVDDEGRMNGRWESEVYGDSGNLWGRIDWKGLFNLYSDYAACYGHGDWIDGVRVLVIDGCESRGKSPARKMPFRDLREVKPKAQAGDLIGSDRSTPVTAS